MHSEEETIATELILRHFVPDLIPNGEERLEEVRQLLIERINFLLDHDFEKLLWILYRIDVSEEKAKMALSESSGRTPAQALAELIIDRQIEKVKARARLRNDRREK